jgi:hypothetical protein
MERMREANKVKRTFFRAWIQESSWDCFSFVK